MLPSWSLARARLARAVRDGRPAGDVDELRRTYRAARLASQITDALSADLPPSREHRAELARLLLAEGDARAAA